MLGDNWKGRGRHWIMPFLLDNGINKIPFVLRLLLKFEFLCSAVIFPPLVFPWLSVLFQGFTANQTRTVITSLPPTETQGKALAHLYVQTLISNTGKTYRNCHLTSETNLRSSAKNWCTISVLWLQGKTKDRHPVLMHLWKAGHGTVISELSPTCHSTYSSVIIIAKSPLEIRAKTSTMDLFKKDLRQGISPLYCSFLSVFLEVDCLKTPSFHFSSFPQQCRW